MIIELNIGLDIAGSANTASMHDSREVFALAFLKRNPYAQNILAVRRAQSGTEQTLVVKLQVSSGAENRVREVIEHLAFELDQDCIALYNATEYRGELIGPRTAAWGAFNPEFFVRADEGARPAYVAA